jgi:hypothetical protein
MVGSLKLINIKDHEPPSTKKWCVDEKFVNTIRDVPIFKYVVKRVS